MNAPINIETTAENLETVLAIMYVQASDARDRARDLLRQHIENTRGTGVATLIFTEENSGVEFWRECLKREGVTNV